MPFFGGGGASASNMVGATSSAAGTAGLVPAPAAGNKRRALSSNALFEEPALLPNVIANQANRVVGTYGNTAVPTGQESLTAKRRAFNLIYIPDDLSVDFFAVRVGSSAPSPAYNFHLALWKVGEDGLPSDYVIGGTVSSGTSANTTLTFSVSATAAKRGMHYVSLTTDANSGTNILMNDPTFATNCIFGSAAFAAGGNQQYPTYVATTYDQTTHETIAYTNFGRLPFVGIGYL